MIAHFTINSEDLISLQKNMISNDKTHKKLAWLTSFLGFFAGFIIFIIMVGNMIGASVVGVMGAICTPYLYKIISLQKYKLILKKKQFFYDGKL